MGAETNRARRGGAVWAALLCLAAAATVLLLKGSGSDGRTARDGPQTPHATRPAADADARATGARPATLDPADGVVFGRLLRAADHVPLEGAAVVLEGTRRDEGVSGRGGYFLVEAVPTDEALRLTVMTDSAQVRSSVPPLTPREARNVGTILVGDCGKISGTVCGRGGRAIEDAGITVWSWYPGEALLSTRRTEDAAAVARTATSSSGHFEVLVGPGTYEVRATAPDHVPEHMAPLAIAPGGAVTVEFRLDPGGVVLSGIVLDDADEPVRGTLYVAPLLALHRITVVRVGADGLFEVPGLARLAPYHLRFVAADGQQVTHTVNPPVRGRYELRLATGPSIRGVVVGRESSSPVPDAVVRLVGGSGSRAQTVTDENGAFALPGVGLGSQYVLETRASGYAPAVTAVRARVDGDGAVSEYVVTIQLEAPRELIGLVVEGDGARRISDCRVFVVPFPHGAPMFQAATDEDGLFRITDVPPLRLALAAIASGLRSRRADGGGAMGMVAPEVDMVDLSAGPPEDPVILRVYPVAAIQGRVVDDAHEPIAGVMVRVMPSPSVGGTFAAFDSHPQVEKSCNVGVTVTSTDGTFVLADLPAGGRVLITAEHPDFGSAYTDHVEVGTRVLELVLARGNVVRGRVTSQAGGTAVPGAEVEVAVRRDLRPALATPHEDRRVTYSDADGRYDVSGLPQGTVRVRIRAPGFVYASAEGRLEQPSGGVSEHDFCLGTGAALHGIVLADSQPVPDTWVNLRVEGRTQTAVPGNLVFRTDDSGEFVADGLPPGTYLLHASSESAGTGTSRVEIRGGGQHQARIELSAVRLAIRALDMLGEPVAGLHLVVRDVGSRSVLATVRTDAAGSAVCAVRRGAVVVEPHHTDPLRLLVRPLEVALDQAAHEIVVAVMEAERFIVQLVDANRTPVADVSLRVRAHGEAAWTRGRTGASGRAEFVAPRGATVEIEARPSGYLPARLRQQAPDSEVPIHIQLDRGLGIEGRIEGPGSPGLVVAVRAEGGSAEWVQQTLVEPDGTFRVTGLREGTYVLDVVGPRRISVAGVAAGRSDIRIRIPEGG